MSAPKLSVIIPVYAVEPYLARCVESVLTQSFTDMEIILVDDGSPDACPALCDAYARQDSRVRVIHQNNMGLAGARNSGLRLARGEYVAFLDSDDWAREDAYEKLYAKARACDADMVFCQAAYFDDSRQALEEADDNSALPLLRGERFSGAFSWREIGVDKIFSYDSFVVAWNKICRREFLERHQAEFPVGLIYEDNPFYYQTIFAAQRLAVVPERLIRYRINRKGSIIADIGERKNAKAMQVLAILAHIEDRLRRLLPEQEFRQQFNAFAYNEIRYKFALIPESLQRKYLALAQGLLPRALYLKLRWRIAWERFNAQPRSWRSFIRYVKAPRLRRLELFRNIPLVLAEKSDAHPGEFSAVIAFGESPELGSAITGHFSGNAFACYSCFNSLDLADGYRALATHSGHEMGVVCRNGPEPPEHSAPPHQSPGQPTGDCLRSIKSLLAISGSALFLDFARASLPPERLKLLFYDLNCLYYEKDIGYLRLIQSKAPAPMPRAVPGLRYTAAGSAPEMLKRLPRILRGMELKRFHRYLSVRIVGLPVLVARKR